MAAKLDGEDCRREDSVVDRRHSVEVSEEREAPGRNELPAMGSIALTYAAAFTSSWNGVRIGGVNVVDFILISAVILAFLAAARSRRRLPLYWWAVLPPGVLLLISLYGSIVRGDPLSSSRIANQYVVGSAIGAEHGGAIPLILRIAISLTAVVLIVAAAADGQRGFERIRNVMVLWAAGAAASGLYAVIEEVVPPLGDLPFLYRALSDSRVSGLSNHPNQLGQVIAVALPMIMLMASAQRGLKKALLSGVIPVLLFAIILTGSRAALVFGPMLVAGTACYLIYRSRKVPVWLLIAAPLIAVTALIAVPAILASSRFSDESGEISNASRLVSIRQGLDDFSSSPLLGYAVGGPAPTMVPLTILVYGGLLFFVIFYASLLYPVLLRSTVHFGAFKAVLVITALGVLSYGLLNNGWTDRYLYWPFAALFALHLCADGRSMKRTSGALSSSPRTMQHTSSRSTGRAAVRTQFK